MKLGKKGMIGVIIVIIIILVAAWYMTKGA